VLGQPARLDMLAGSVLAQPAPIRIVTG